MSTLHNNTSQKVAMTLWMPQQLRDDLQLIANNRAISLSALIRLALSEYVKSKK